MPREAEPRTAAPVRAAGRVLWRRAAGGGVEVALVHRARYDDRPVLDAALARLDGAQASVHVSEA